MYGNPHIQKIRAITNLLHHPFMPSRHAICWPCSPFQGPTKTWRRRRRFGQSASGWSKRWPAFWRASVFSWLHGLHFIVSLKGKGTGLSIPKKKKGKGKNHAFVYIIVPGDEHDVEKVFNKHWFLRVKDGFRNHMEPSKNGGFQKMVVPPVLIHLERWDFPSKKPSSYWGYPHSRNPPNSGWWFGCHFLCSQKYWVANHPNWRTHIFQRAGEKPPTGNSFWTSVSHELREISGRFMPLILRRSRRSSEA